MFYHILGLCQRFLEGNNIFEVLHSGFRIYPSTETELVTVQHNVFLTTDTDYPTVLVLLELSSAFKTMNLNICIAQFERCVHMSIKTEASLCIWRMLLKLSCIDAWRATRIDSCPNPVLLFSSCFRSFHFMLLFSFVDFWDSVCPSEMYKC